MFETDFFFSEENQIILFYNFKLATNGGLKNLIFEKKNWQGALVASHVINLPKSVAKIVQNCASSWKLSRKPNFFISQL
jgi:hypothetical protein